MNTTIKLPNITPPTGQRCIHLSFVSEDFSGLKGDELEKLKQTKELSSIHIKPSNLSHLLLSSKDNYHILAKKYGGSDLYKQLTEQLQYLLNEKAYKIRARIYYTMYRCVK